MHHLCSMYYSVVKWLDDFDGKQFTRDGTESLFRMTVKMDSFF